MPCCGILRRTNDGQNVCRTAGLERMSSENAPLTRGSSSGPGRTRTYDLRIMSPFQLGSLTWENDRKWALTWPFVLSMVRASLHHFFGKSRPERVLG